MAVTLLQSKVSVDLDNVVSNSIIAVKAVRNSERARKEAEFQRAIANGLSYEEQIAMREEQIKEERESSFSDSEYIAVLEKSITDTRKLNRFSKYRTRYAESLSELSSGKINEEQYLSILKNQLNGINDSDLRIEIQGDIAAAEEKLKTYNDTILSNQVKKAKYDGTKVALSEAIAKVNVARTKALLNENEDEVTAYDETLSALQSQLSGIRIQDSLTDFQVRSSTKGINPIEKLTFISSEIQNADIATPIKIGDRTFESAQQFWSLERDNFLAGNSQVFGNFFDELNAHVKNTVDSNTVKFGYPTQSVLDDVFRAFTELRAKPEIAPFVNRLDATQAGAMNDAVDKYAQHLVDVVQGTSEFSFKQADSEMQKVSSRYTVDLTARRVQLQNLSLSDKNIPQEEIPELDLKLPSVDVSKPSTPASTPATPPATPTTPVTRQVRTGESLSLIAQEAGISLSQLLELNPSYKENPEFVREGATLNVPGKTIEETPKPIPSAVPPVTPTSTPTPTPPAIPQSQTPVQTPATPVEPPSGKQVPAKKHTREEAITYLKSIGYTAPDEEEIKGAMLELEGGAKQ